MQGCSLNRLGGDGPCHSTPSTAHFVGCALLPCVSVSAESVASTTYCTLPQHGNTRRHALHMCTWTTNATAAWYRNRDRVPESHPHARVHANKQQHPAAAAPGIHCPGGCAHAASLLPPLRPAHSPPTRRPLLHQPPPQPPPKLNRTVAPSLGRIANEGRSRHPHLNGLPSLARSTTSHGAHHHVPWRAPSWSRPRRTPWTAARRSRHQPAEVGPCTAPSLVVAVLVTSQPSPSVHHDLFHSTRSQCRVPVATAPCTGLASGTGEVPPQVNSTTPPTPVP